jgi:hypothetical protein
MRRCRDAYVVVTPPPGLERNPALKGRAKVIRSLRDRHVFREGMHFKKRGDDWNAGGRAAG